jgi:hypothetical protein
MRQTISGFFAAFAVLFAGAAPAMACGYSTCSPCGYTSPCAQTYYAPVYSAPTYGYATTGCGTCGTSWGYERLAEPESQYYYVNQGPTFTGPGAYAPYPVYRETAAVGWGAYERAPGYYGYHHRYHAWHHSYRYGYMPHRYAYHYGYHPYWHHYPVLRRYY